MNPILSARQDDGETPPSSHRCKILNELFTGKHPEWITDRMFPRLGIDRTGYVQQVQKHGGWLHVDTTKGNNTPDLNEIQHWIESWQWRDRPTRTAWDQYVASVPQLPENLPSNPRFEAVSSNDVLSIRPLLLDPNTNERMDVYRARNFFRWRYNVSVNHDFEDGIYDNYTSTHTPKVSTKFFPPLSLCRTNVAEVKLHPSHLANSNLNPTGQTLGYSSDLGWFFQPYKFFPCIKDWTSQQLPGSPTWTASDLATFKERYQPLEGKINPYHCARKAPIFREDCPPGACYIERTNHLTPSNPPFLGGPFRHAEFAVVFGWMEQVSLYSKGKVSYNTNNLLAWAYRDLTSRNVNDWFTFSGTMTSAIIAANNLLDPLTPGLRFRNSGYAWKYMAWRRSVVSGESDDTIYDNCVHVPINSHEEVTTRTFKPLPLHKQGKPMSWMPPTIYEDVDYSNEMYGWYFQKHKKFPDFTNYSLEQMPSGAQGWSPMELSSWKTKMRYLAGEDNPYYVELSLS
jgi:hypothetical protein